MPIKPKPLHIEHVKGLAVGDKLTDVPGFHPRSGVNQTRIFRGDGHTPSQDLVEVSSPTLSKYIKRSAGESSHDDHDGAFLFTSIGGGVVENLVIFNDKTERIEGILGPNLLKPGLQPAYKNVFPPREVGFSLLAEPIKTAGSWAIKLVTHDATHDISA